MSDLVKEEYETFDDYLIDEMNSAMKAFLYGYHISCH